MAHEDSSKANFAHKHLSFDGSRLVCTSVGDRSGYTAPNTVERIEIAGQAKAPARVTLTAGGTTTELQFFHDVDRAVLTIKKPDCLMTDDWVVALS